MFKVLWMRVQVEARLCVYTSAGAGPVSLGLVTVLALLLTCRGQCRGNMTQTHTHAQMSAQQESLHIVHVQKHFTHTFMDIHGTEPTVLVSVIHGCSSRINANRKGETCTS